VSRLRAGRQLLLQFHHVIHQVCQVVCQNHLRLGKYLIFFFGHLLPDDAHEFVKFPLKLCFVKINALQLAHEFSDVLMGEAAVSHELRPILAGHLVIRRVEDVLFQLRVQIESFTGVASILWTSNAKLGRRFLAIGLKCEVRLYHWPCFTVRRA
jgi:hypothetical protein